MWWIQKRCSKRFDDLQHFVVRTFLGKVIGPYTMVSVSFLFVGMEIILLQRTVLKSETVPLESSLLILLVLFGCTCGIRNVL